MEGGCWGCFEEGEAVGGDGESEQNRVRLMTCCGI